MKIYNFWSADTTYFTKSKSLKKAQEIGKNNMKHYIETCEYLQEEPEVNESYFIPNEVETITAEYFTKMVKTDKDILILDDELLTMIQ